MKIPDDIVATAKEAVLRFGYFKPSLFVEGTDGKLYTHLPFGQTNDDRVQIMTEAGIELAKSGKLGSVERVIFVSEAWVGPARTPYVPPSQDPDRMEVLLFNVLDAESGRAVFGNVCLCSEWTQRNHRPLTGADAGGR